MSRTVLAEGPKYQYTYIHLNPIGIIDAGWKNKQITDKNKAGNFLREYEFSSYRDYMETTREESSILNKSAFPEYFLSCTDFQEMIDEWMNFSEL